MKQSLLILFAICFLSIGLSAQTKQQMGTNISSPKQSINVKKGKIRQKSVGERESIWDQMYTVNEGEWITPIVHPKDLMKQGTTYEVELTTIEGDADLQIAGLSSGNKRSIRESQNVDLALDNSYYELNDLLGSEESIAVGIKGYKASRFKLQIYEVQSAPPVDPCTIINVNFDAATAGGTVNLSINTSFPQEISFVEYRANGQSLGNFDVSPFSFQYQTPNGGNYDFEAIIHYAQTSELCTLTQNVFIEEKGDPCNLGDPQFLLEPKNSAFGNMVALSIKTDFPQEVSRVEYFANGGLIGWADQSPFSYNHQTNNASKNNYEAKISYAQSSEPCILSGQVSTPPNNTCNWEFRFDKCTDGYKHPLGRDYYVRVRADKHQDIEWMELYINGQKISREANAPYDWGLPNSTDDAALRNMSPGSYNIKCVVKDKCGNTHEKYCNITVEGTHQNCEWKWKNQNEICEKHINHGAHWRFKMEPEHHNDIEWVEWYRDNTSSNNKMRRETSYPFEWNSQNNADSKMRNWSPGRHKIIIRVKKRCHNQWFEKECWVHIDGNSNNQCNSRAHFSDPRDNSSFNRGDHIYVKVNADRHQDIEYMELYLNNRYLRKENSAPYEWNKHGTNNDPSLRNLSSGTHTLKCRYKTKCGTYHETFSRINVRSN
ncbi:MAG: Ig-like domain-containing protein [Saprospiraceae bacterium]